MPYIDPAAQQRPSRSQKIEHGASFIALALFTLCGVVGVSGRSWAQAPNLQTCAALPNEGQRVQCAERLLANSGSRPAPAAPTLSGDWHLSRTTDPRTGIASVTVLHTADFNSDADFAGLMFRCGQNGVETLLAILQPIPPSAKPAVTVRSGATETRHTAQVLELGTLLLLPDVSADQAVSQWASSPEIAFQIAASDPSIRGMVPTAGLAAAVQALKPNCISR